ncbi:hypothetical protein NQ556_16195 [Coprococcus comes ATCC 27758]|jgi:hypothetical protein|uniref:hypothetical protein n=1 Tax=Coprococcus comes TaxID=410072 RepID=UPI001FAFF7E9|nr:hypothetical protein [Coprococcus comes]UWP14110.1 hypothetical protein NQ556_16195 [Coprococcus comes ATCC 27758]
MESNSTAFLIKIKLRHSLGRPSRSDFVQSEFVKLVVNFCNNEGTVADEVDPELLAKVLANPEIRALLNSLAKTMK